jgi:hypothetical protein
MGEKPDGFGRAAPRGWRGVLFPKLEGSFESIVDRNNRARSWCCCGG